MIFTLLLAAVLPAAGCHSINADHIYARDLAAAVPLFASLPPDLAIGYSPSPGWQRMFHAAELQRLAKANHLQGDVSEDVCFAWTMAVPEPDRIIAAMKKALAGRDVRIEMVDRSRMSAPPGELVFPPGGASIRSAAPVLWRGYVSYAGNRRFNVWASVLITVKGTRVVAVNPLHVDEPIGAGDIRAEPYEGPLLAVNAITDTKAAIGMTPRRPIAAGDPLFDNLLEPAKDVLRGDTVEVVVNGGGALIRTAGVAEESGNRGAMIVVRNTTSGRKFRARVQDKGKVSVVPGVAAGLIAKDQKS
jgi:flagella basal body P-ring formation protein FlgA